MGRFVTPPWRGRTLSPRGSAAGPCHRAAASPCRIPNEHDGCHMARRPDRRIGITSLVARGHALRTARQPTASRTTRGHVRETERTPCAGAWEPWTARESRSGPACLVVTRWGPTRPVGRSWTFGTLVGPRPGWAPRPRRDARALARGEPPAPVPWPAPRVSESPEPGVSLQSRAHREPAVARGPTRAAWSRPSSRSGRAVAS